MYYLGKYSICLVDYPTTLTTYNFPFKISIQSENVSVFYMTAFVVQMCVNLFKLSGELLCGSAGVTIRLCLL